MAPSMGYNLVSTGRLADNGIESNFGRNSVRLDHESHRFHIGTGSTNSENVMYMLSEAHHGRSSDHEMVASVHAEMELWHRRLAHINARDLTNVHAFADGVPNFCPMQDV